MAGGSKGRRKLGRKDRRDTKGGGKPLVVIPDPDGGWSGVKEGTS